MIKPTIAVLFGGSSNEYEVSLQSAASVISQLSPHKYSLLLVGITRDGSWMTYKGSVEEIRTDRWHKHVSCTPAFISPNRAVKGLIQLVHTEYRVIPVDVVFPVLHGKFGEDGTLQGLLELAGLPYVGCGSLASALAMDKDIAHKLAAAAGVEVPKAVTVYKGESISTATEEAAKLGYPLYVKPVRSGSSIGISKVNHAEELYQAVELAFTYDHKVVIEQNVPGFEVGCAVLGNREPIVGTVDEIELTDGFFNFTEKYTLQSSRIHLPARITEQLEERVQKTALLIYQVLGCSGFARVDLFVTPEERIVFNEVNTIPGFTKNSRYPNMLQAAGYSFSEILDKLIAFAQTELR